MLLPGMKDLSHFKNKKLLHAGKHQDYGPFLVGKASLEPHCATKIRGTMPQGHIIKDNRKFFLRHPSHHVSLGFALKKSFSSLIKSNCNFRIFSKRD
jgi:hypothetical protein